MYGEYGEFLLKNLEQASELPSNEGKNRAKKKSRFQTPVGFVWGEQFWHLAIFFGGGIPMTGSKSFSLTIEPYGKKEATRLFLLKNLEQAYRSDNQDLTLLIPSRYPLLSIISGSISTFKHKNWLARRWPLFP